MHPEIVNKIKTRGYWRVNFRPLMDGEKLSLVECKDVVERNSVSKRGWDFPHIPRRESDDSSLSPGSNYYQGWVDWENHKDFWRMYQSGQFLGYNGLREDWLDEANQLWREHFGNITHGEKLNIVGSVIYQVTEFYAFLERLVLGNLYDEGVHVNISIHNTRNRELYVEDPMRGPFLHPYRCAIDEISFSKDYSRGKIEGFTQNNSLEVIKHVYDRFGWHDASADVIKSDQDKLLKGLI